MLTITRRAGAVRLSAAPAGIHFQMTRSKSRCISINAQAEGEGRSTGENGMSKLLLAICYIASEVLALPYIGRCISNVFKPHFRLHKSYILTVDLNLIGNY